MFSIRVVLSQGTRSIDYGIFEISSADDFDAMRNHLYSIKGISRGRFWLTSLHLWDNPENEEWSVIRIAANLLRCECFEDWLELLASEYEWGFNSIPRSERAKLLDTEVFTNISCASDELRKCPSTSWKSHKRGLLSVFVTKPFGLSNVREEKVAKYFEVLKELHNVGAPPLLSYGEFNHYKEQQRNKV